MSNLWQRCGGAIAGIACALAFSVLGASAAAAAPVATVELSGAAAQGSSSEQILNAPLNAPAVGASGSAEARAVAAPPSASQGSEGARASAPAPRTTSGGAGAPLGRGSVLRVLLGLALAVVLAIVAAHPRVRAVETRFGLTLAIASGLPFLVLGVLFRHPRIDILDASVLAELDPFVEMGLGWIGFVVGHELDFRRLEDLPDRTSAAVALEGLVPFALVLVGALAGALALAPGAFTLRGGLDVLQVRDALVLAACAALSAATAPLALARGAGRDVARLLDRIAQLDDGLALLVLLLLGSFLRPASAHGWELPPTGWAFLTLGLGGVLGGLSWALVRGARSDREELALTLGAVAFSAGVAGRLALSPLVVCAVAGALLANLPGRRGATGNVDETLKTVERPVSLLLLVIAGAVAPFERWQTWALAGGYLALRALGKVVGVALARRAGPAELRAAPGVALAMMPQSPMATATTLSAVMLYARSAQERDGHLQTIMGAVLAASFLNDVGVQLVAQWVNRLSPDAIDEAAQAVSLVPPPFDEARAAPTPPDVRHDP